ncbi:MAG TPA: IMP dehydrogenase [Nevskiaceae bacterium]|nr:IMP dehydrogenase [Nevskiaceae bacterium]
MSQKTPFHRSPRIEAEALTFDDVLLQPEYSEVLPREVDLRTHLTQRITLNIPLLSAAMDTVTEARLAIALAQEGGIGIVHKNMTPERQAAEVRRVKKYESGVVTDPITVSPDTTLEEVLRITHANHISGMPVVQGKQLVGIVTSRDLRFEKGLSDSVSSVMTPKDRLVTVHENAPREEAVNLLREHRVEKVLVINDAFELRGLITVKDIQKATAYPRACKDAHGRLRVGAAVGTGADTEARVAGLVEAGADVVIVDTAHGHSRGVIERVGLIKRKYPELQVIGGNIATAEAALALADAGADAVKVGIGPGSICTTRIVAGVGVPQVSAIMAVADALRARGIPLIGDGGVRYSGDFAKALAAGAYTVMVGSMLAGTEEAPGEIELYKGRAYKSYRGMGSLGAMVQGSKDRYFQDTTSEVEKLVPEGIEGRVPYKGPLSAIVYQMVGGLRACMGYTGCHTVDELRTKTHFVKITGAGVRESHVHDVTITKEAPNYHAS